MRWNQENLQVLLNGYERIMVNRIYVDQKVHLWKLLVILLGLQLSCQTNSVPNYFDPSCWI